MPMVHFITAVITGLISIGALVIAIFQFKEKGPVFTNSYLLSSPQEREKLNKKAEYRLAAIVFLSFCVLLALATAGILTQISVFFNLSIAGAVLLCVYVVVDAVKSGEFS